MALIESVEALWDASGGEPASTRPTTQARASARGVRQALPGVAAARMQLVPPAACPPAPAHCHPLSGPWARTCRAGRVAFMSSTLIACPMTRESDSNPAPPRLHHSFLAGLSTLHPSAAAPTAPPSPSLPGGRKGLALIHLTRQPSAVASAVALPPSRALAAPRSAPWRLTSWRGCFWSPLPTKARPVVRDGPLVAPWSAASRSSATTSRSGM